VIQHGVLPLSFSDRVALPVAVDTELNIVCNLGRLRFSCQAAIRTVLQKAFLQIHQICYSFDF
jgi:hypothetical protein